MQLASKAGVYRYGFNGKENDNEVKGEGNQQDYGMRIYDPRIGKFLSVDPLTPKYLELTPYQFASNRPIDGIDEDGLEYAPAGNNTGGVPRDNTAVQKYVNHPESIAADFKFNKALKMLSGSSKPAGLNGKPNLSPELQRRENERMAQAFLDRGWNADGSEPAWHKFTSNKYIGNLSQNMVEPMVGMAVGDGLFNMVGEGVSLSLSQSSTSIGLFRRGANVGAFSELEVPMQMRTVKQTAERACVGLKGVKLRIERDPGLIGRNIFGHANKNTITLYPDAFTNMETLVRTLGHERTHIMQFKSFGPPTSSAMGEALEKGAWGIEETFWNFYKGNK
ncbi:hypothetical protein MRBLMN1_003156 [Chitinophaga ginsengisegetis]|uniref:RHS repeat domain-containing protein n=1 Tax=Chitinophaga ginsengisegetis TaxID=393003 RepID=UPI003416D8F3